MPETGTKLLQPIRRVYRLLRLLGVTGTVRFVYARLRGEPLAQLHLRGVRTPVFCRTHGSDIFVLWQVFQSRELAVSLHAPPRFVIDGGANVGYAALFFANCYPAAQIVAIEPDPENCAVFRRNCAPYPNIELVQGGLWHTHTHLVIENHGAPHWAFRVTPIAHPTTDSFPAYTISDILAMRPEYQTVDLLKLDIEGAEEPLFAANADAWLDRVVTMMIETHGPQARNVVLAALGARKMQVSSSGEYLIIHIDRP